MTGDEDYLFDEFDVINEITISHEKRLSNNGNNTTTLRYVRRRESESSSEGEGSGDGNLETEKNDVSFI